MYIVTERGMVNGRPWQERAEMIISCPSDFRDDLIRHAGKMTYGDLNRIR